MHPFVSNMTSKGQVTIPVAIRRRLGLSPHDKVEFLMEDSQVRIMPAHQGVVARTAGMLRSAQPQLSPEEETIAAEEVMAEEAEGRKV